MFYLLNYLIPLICKEETCSKILSLKSEGLFKLFCFIGIWWYIASLAEFGNLLQNVHFKMVVDDMKFNICSFLITVQ